MRVRMRIITVLCIILFLNLGSEFTNADMAAKGNESAISAFQCDKKEKREKEFHLFYILYGGINNWCNPDQYNAGDCTQLRIPYRFGYTFDGWYLDKTYTRRIERITPQQTGDLVLYAKWNDNINNRYNVIHYPYRSSQIMEKNTIRLKDCEYSFFEELNIPGMPSTRSDDFLNNFIFSESQCPQGICYTDDFVLITSYSVEQECQGEILVFDKETGEYLVTLGMDPNSHLGGIAFDGTNIWVCNSFEKTIERISYDFIRLMAINNRGSVIDATTVVDIFPVENSPSCITFYGGRLWIATHSIMLNSKVVAYYYNENGKELKSLGSYKIPRQVQGIAFDKQGRVYLSTSYGRRNSSYIKIYRSIVEMATNPKKPEIQVEMPPGSEEVDIEGETLSVIFESAGEKYYEGTDGKGTSISPIDKVLQIDITSINN